MSEQGAPQQPFSSGRGRSRDFLLPDNLRPPSWGRFRGRWIALLVLSGLWLAALKLKALWPESRTAMLYAYAGSCAVLLAVGISIYGWRRLGAELKRVSPGSVAWHIGAVTVLLVAGGKLFEWLGVYSGDPEPPEPGTIPAKLACARLLAVGLAGPLAEEFALRFVVYGALRARLKFIWSALISSLLFGLLHFGYPEPIKMLMCALAGMFLCWTYERTGSILTPAGIHVLNNLLGI